MLTAGTQVHGVLPTDSPRGATFNAIAAATALSSLIPIEVDGLRARPSLATSSHMRPAAISPAIERRTVRLSSLQ